MTSIWWRLGVIKAVKCVFQCLTLNPWYLTLRAKIQNSAAWDLCVWSQRTFLCVFSTLLSKLWDKFQKVRKNAQKWPVFHPHRFNRFSDDLETYARILLFLRCICMSVFVMIGLRESGQKRWTDGRLQDFVHEATQIDKLTNSEQNRHLQTINSKQIKLQRVTIIIISI